MVVSIYATKLSEISRPEWLFFPPASQQIKKYLKGLNLNPVKIKKPHKCFCYVTFRSDEDRQVFEMHVGMYAYTQS